jgi:hypothetical protein
MKLRKFILRNDDAGSDAGGGAAVVDAPDAGGKPSDAGAKPADSADAGAKPAAVDDKGGKPADKGAKADDGKGADGKAGDGKGAPNEGYWPADWRETVSKGDAKVLQRMGRYASPQAAMEALIAAQNRISAGELKPVLGKNATPEQVKEWREANGIPEAHDKYDLGDAKLENVKPEHLDIILKNAHETNQTPEQVKATMGALKNVLTDMQTSMVEKDATDQVTNEDSLRNEWGGEFRKNINLIHGLLDGQADPNLKENFLRARMPDGTLVGNDPKFMRMMLGLSLIQNPTGTVVPGAGGNQEAGIKQELEKIQTTMKNDRAAYNKDAKMQERFRELTNAAIKMGAMDENGNWKK